MKSELDSVIAYFEGLQDRICEGFESFEQASGFREDQWSHARGGGGRTRVMASSTGTFEKVGVNFSHVCGDKLPDAASAQRPQLAGLPFHATGVSLVAHPLNPYVPTSHMNVRFLVAGLDESEPVWWFGGGYDLTPYYGFAEDVIHWHSISRDACSRFRPDAYATYKKWCDEYFFNRHRGETRGVGGLFFDDLNEEGFLRCFEFVRTVGESFTDAYFPIVERRRDLEYGEREREWQLYRRGRYVEFNLIYDRGTLFGLQSGGRTESILMSLPPLVSFRYDHHPEPGSEEARLLEGFLGARDWLNPG